MRRAGEGTDGCLRWRRAAWALAVAAAALTGCRTSDDGLERPPAEEPEPPPSDPPSGAPGPAPGPRDCAGGAVHCVGNTPQVCGADGRWVTQQACGYSCQEDRGCVNRFVAVSSGRGSPTDQDGRAEFAVNRETVFSERGGLLGARGFNVAVLDPAGGQQLEPVRNFDPWASPLTGRALDDLADYLAALEPGLLVMIAVSDDAGITGVDRCGPNDSAPVQRLVGELQRLGSNLIGGYCFRGAWSIIAVTGQHRALAEKISAGAKVSTEVLLPIGP
jgi:hypothetical protein